MAKAPIDKCSSISFEGERCARQTRDSTGLCALHRRYFRSLLEVETLHCDDCPLPIRDKEGVVDFEKTRERRCSKYMTFVNGLCFFEVGDMFNGFGDRDSFLREMEWVLQKEKLLIKRNLMFQAKSASYNPEVGKLMDTYFTHVKKTGEAAGLIGTGRGAGIPVQNEQEATDIIKALMEGNSGRVPDVDNVKVSREAGATTMRDEANLNRDLSVGPMEKRPEVKTAVFKELTEDEGGN